MGRMGQMGGGVRSLGVLMSGAMVRAILEDRKGMTRRVVKPQPPEGWLPEVGWFHPTLVDRRTGEEYPGERIFGAHDGEHGVRCPYGAPGDRLWVREMWQECGVCGVVNYRADRQWFCRGCDGGLGKWKPSIYLRREASRIELEVTGVRVERLREITEEDAIAEGIASDTTGVGWTRCAAWWPTTSVTGISPVDSYASLWESINGRGAWDLNPWVWVVEFRRIER